MSKELKAQDLRIGNTLSYHNQNVNVMSINEDVAEFGYFIDSIGFERSYSSIDFPKPIELTKEWLFKVGFEIDGVFCDYILRLCDEKMLGYSLEHSRVYLAQHHKGQHFRDVNLGEFNYLHQFQNLFFALTGTELQATKDV